MLSEGPWIFVGLTNLVKVNCQTELFYYLSFFACSSSLSLSLSPYFGHPIHRHAYLFTNTFNTLNIVNSIPYVTDVSDNFAGMEYSNRN